MTGIIAHLLWYSLRWEIWFSRAEFQAFYGEGIIQHAQKKAEGRQLSEPSTWECSQVHWDDGLMQSLSSMSFEADPLPTLPHTWITLLISLPLCLILLPCSALVSHLLFPHAFFFLPFSLSAPFSPYLLSLQPLLCIAVSRKWERHSITVFMESLMAGRGCVLLATANRERA